jgi:glycosyltransferase involved in cell wall biosynthesis
VITLAETGGAQKYIAQLLPALSRGFDVAVAAHGQGPLREASSREGARFISLRHVRRSINPWRDLAGLVELMTIVRRERPDILHANSSKAGLLGRLAGVLAGAPIRIFTVHGWAFSAHSGLSSTVYRWAERLMSGLTTVTICVAESELRAGVEALACRPERAVVIRNGIDVATVGRSERGDGGVPVILSVGRLKAPKDFVTLVRALAGLRPREFRALLVGAGPQRDAIQAEVRRLGLETSIELLGQRSDVGELMSTGDVFALSSRSEGLPISILEAMAAGLPVVASAVGGVPELVVGEETGLLVPPGDPKRLSDALARLLDDRELRQRLGEQGRRRIEEGGFDLLSFQRAHVELYRGELAERGLPVPEP